MIDRTLRVLPVGDHEAVASMTVRDVLETAIPARSFLPNARLNPIEKREVERVRDLHALIQRDFAGEKRRNAQGSLADYIQRAWLSNGKKPSSGFLGPFVIYFPDPLNIDKDDEVAHVTSRGVLLDGESRGEGFLVNIERLPDAAVDKLLAKQVAVHIVHGIQDVKAIAKYFADLNGKGVRVNPNLVAMADYTDPFAEITKRVFEELKLELETRQRQVPAKSNAIMTGLQARTVVAAVAKGVAAVQYGAKPIPAEGVDLAKLESVATTWLERVFKRFEATSFRDKGLVLRSVPVSASLGALGHAFLDGKTEQQKAALEVLSDKKIDWTAGPHWNGVAGKVNLETGKFAVGGAKEYAYTTTRALTEPTSAVGKQIRHESEQGAAA